MKNILFTGAGGYIGSHTAFTFLSNLDSNITVIDNLSSGFIENIEFLKYKFKDRISFIKLDLSNENEMKDLFKNNIFDAVVHFAASLIVEESTIKPLLYYLNNTKNTLALINLCIEFGVNKFIFSSTAAVYGEPKKIPVSEGTQLMPINPYGNSKMMSEIILKDTSKAYKNFNYVALRYFNVAGALSQNEFRNTKYGLGQRSKNATHLIKIACECATNKREVMSIFGDDYNTKDGTCIRDYIHIDDLALAHLSSYEFLQNNKQSEVFNVGYNNGYSVKEIINKVKEISNIDFKVLNASRRSGDPANLVADNSKILSLTSWKPKYNDINYIIKSAYDWEINLGK
ncbi:UDP-glucose 4-epimerase GalE [Helicobacter sp. MIT 14-3879]|uniref:UDP-glucose 4-epimerase GalE n=1 Tax=Helicobacter sp. MIT 14-3879 TaxID=2040649 RepID=UPI000E1F4B4F|nr:UDP-glucose 4-epimerase GalE [Helicobacter sp. MIT 14-3879]RDU65414.1 UDP-glucose 4-epimerase GalE [Helicobacter sp. MIT 14-3879]